MDNLDAPSSLVDTIIDANRGMQDGANAARLPGGNAYVRKHGQKVDVI